MIEDFVKNIEEAVILREFDFDIKGSLFLNINFF